MKTEWDYTHLYKNSEDWEKDYLEQEDNLQKLSNKLDNLSFDKDVFITIITDKFKIEETIERLYCYGKRHVDQDSTNEEMTNLYQRAWGLYSKLIELQSKIENLINENSQDIEKWLNEPEINHYQTYLNSILANKKHLVSDENNNLLSLLNKQQLLINQMYRSLIEQDIEYGEFENHKGKKVISDNRELNKYSKSDYASERRDSFLANMKGYKQLENSMATLMNMKLEKEANLAKIKKYDSVLDMRLSNDLLPSDTVNNLITKVNEHLDFIHDYTELKKKILGLDEYHQYDKALSISEVNSKHYDIEEAIDIIKKALNVLGPEAISYIDRALEEGWIDFFEKPNKRKDAFTCISYTGVPYVSINFHNNMQGLRTLGHELGHMIHTALSKDNQPYEYFEYSLFLAEIASKVNELLIDEYLINNVESNEEKIYLLDNSIKGIVNSLYNQTMMTEFEVSMFKQKEEKGMLSSNFLNETYASLYKKYNEEVITYDKEVENNWEKIPHYYIQDNFYLWQYATGICIAGKIVYQLKNNPDFKHDYIRFLSLGKSVSVVEALKVINIDLNDGSYIDDTVKVLEKQFKELSRLVK